MSTITSLGATDSGSTSRGTINTNFTNLNTDKAESSTLTAHTAASTNVHGVTGTLVGTTDTQTLTNKTLTTPTIGSFANANHNHTNSAGGGQITDAALSSAVTASKGGTGQTSLTNNALLLGQGTSAVAFVAAGTSGYVLTANGTASAPTYQATSGVSSFKNGTTTRDISTTGDQTIAHGLSGTPKYVRITARLGTSGAILMVESHGVYNGTTTSMVWSGIFSTTQAGSGTSSSNVVYIPINAAESAEAHATIAVDGTNITLTWAKTASPTGTAQILWEAWT